jgi:acyl-CoA thioester hydrolase
MPRIAPSLLDIARYPYVHEVATRFADVDPNWHINNVAMAAGFEDARARFNRAIGLHAVLGELRFMIVSAYYDYLAEARYPDPIAVHVGIAEIGRTSWTMSQVAMQGGRACGYCRSTLVVVGPEGPTPLLSQMREQLCGHMLRLPAVVPAP